MKNFSHDHYDPQDSFESRKERRLERKKARLSDRSKYKKTDRDQKEKRLENRELSQESLKKSFLGTVTHIMADEIRVMCEGKTYICRLKGQLKKEKNLSKNLVIVGDSVFFSLISDAEGVIIRTEPRKSLLSRADNLSRKKEHLIAANIDIVIVTASLMSPPLKPALIDRYLIAAQKGGCTPIIVINKHDLLENPTFEMKHRKEEKATLEECQVIYQSLQIPFLFLSTQSGEGLDQLKDLIKGKISVFSGQSGVGKSSIINFLTECNLKVGKTVEKTSKGSHTTTFAQLLPLPFGGWCVDTPGIKSFGVWDLHEKDVRNFFEDIQKISLQCRFHDCTHTGEEGCAIPQAIKKRKLSLLRYQSYLNLLDSINEEYVKR